MARVEIVESLVREIARKFNQREANEIIDLLRTLEEHPAKGKALGVIGSIVIKELKYRNFRFYFITDGHRLKCIDEGALVDLLLRFVRMSDKTHQQETIAEIKRILTTIGPHGLK